MVISAHFALQYENKNFEQEEIWEKEQKNLSELQQKTICNYIEQIQAVSFEEQQEAYCQGIIDCVQILSGLGLLESDGKIERAIEKLK